MIQSWKWCTADTTRDDNEDNELEGMIRNDDDDDDKETDGDDDKVRNGNCSSPEHNHYLNHYGTNHAIINQPL